MTLSIFSSNRVETLQQNLCHRLNTAPLANPFAREIIVVPTYAMARWLNLRIAQQLGIAANIDYPLPTPWILQLAELVLDSASYRDPLKPETSSWKIFNLLPEMLHRPAFAPFLHYLNNDRTGVKRWQLASRFAEVFDRYQKYRPGLIARWSGGEDDDWQAQLWRTLTTDDTRPHQTGIIEQLIRYLNQGADARLLPRRVSLFAHSSLPPLFIQAIHALAQHTDVTLYQHSPTDQYWADLKDKKTLAKLRLQKPEQAEYFESGNALLASWGRQGQDLQDLLLDHHGLPVCESESYQTSECSTLLQSLQQSIFQINETVSTWGADTSLSIHVCHSPMRECQVLLDTILARLDQDPSLNAEDILVMVPEISRYAPYIEAAFHSNQQAGHPGVSWNLSDITLADETPLVLIFLQLLKLPDSRFSRSEVLSYLDIDEIRHRYDIDDTAAAEIHLVLADSRVRWGIDESHKAALGLPATPHNTWHQAKQRIFSGYALGEADYWQGIAPLAHIDSSRAQSLGKFWLLFERLQYWRDVFKTTRSSDKWQALLNQMLEDFFVETKKSESRLQVIREAIGELTNAECIQISPTLLHHWMKQQLASREFQGRLFSGGVTFCGMRPMRNLPFRMICLLGMNDGVFPRRSNQYEFDNMATSWLPGDPSNGNEDRYLMLETLLCARQYLYISYCGRSLKDNSECQPSVLVRELLDFVDSHYTIDSNAEDLLSEQLTTLHPMQAFSANNFSPYAISYNNYWCQIANQIRMANPGAPAKSWAIHVINNDPQENNNINLNDLRHFVQDPIKFFFNHQLKLWLRAHDEGDDEELFTLSSLDKWEVKTQIASDLIRGRETQAQELQAQGRLPHGHAAHASLDTIYSELDPLLESLQDYRGIACQTRMLESSLDVDLPINGQIKNYYAGKGLMHFTSSSLKGKHLLALWVDHLALCAAGQYNAGESSRFFSRDGSLLFEQLDSADASCQLRHYMDLYNLGLTYPLPVFPLASYAWARAGSSERGLKAARNAWYGNSYRNIPGDRDNGYVKLALRSSMQEPFTSEAFCSYAQALYLTPLKSAIET